jgi:hypothetical protein
MVIRSLDELARWNKLTYMVPAKLARPTSIIRIVMATPGIDRLDHSNDAVRVGGAEMYSIGAERRNVLVESSN